MSFDYKFDVFISFNSKDASIAQYTGEYLENNGLKVFFSDDSCKGEPSFVDKINEALESSRDFLLVVSNADYVKEATITNPDGSNWVADEISKFNIINNKRFKRGLSRGKLISLRTSGVELDDLPLDFQKDSTAVTIDDKDKKKSNDYLLSFFNIPITDVTNYSKEQFVKDYFSYLEKYCGHLKLPSAGNGYEHGRLRDLYVSVPTDRKISVEVKNSRVISISDNNESVNLRPIDESMYSSIVEALNRNITAGIEYKYPKPSNRPKILSPIWTDGYKKDYWVLNAMDAIAVNDKLVVLGDPGTGKSTVLRYLALGLGDQYFSNNNVLQKEILSDEFFINRYFPVFTEVKDFTIWVEQKKDSEASLKGLASFICHRIMNAYHLHENAIRDLLYDRCVFIFDGLDEVSPKNARVILDLLGDIQEHSKDSKIVLACRSKEYINWGFSKVSTVTLKNMDTTVMEKLAGNIFNSFQKKNESDRLFEDIKKKNIDLSVFGVPLFFSLIVGLYINTNRIVGTKKSTVLHESVNLLLNRKYQSIGKSNLSFNATLSSLEIIAFELQKNTNDKSARIPKRLMCGIIGENFSDNSYDSVIRFLKDKAGIINEVIEDDSVFFEFTHRYFQDYLCASYISKQKAIKAANILADALSLNQVHWIEVFMLFIDIMHDKQDYDNLWTVIYRLLDGVKEENNKDWVVWFICKALASNNYFLLQKDVPQYDRRNETILEELKESVFLLLQRDSKLQLQYKKDCLDAIGIMEPDRKGTGLKDGIPEHWWCEVVNKGPFVMGLTEEEIRRIKQTEWGRDQTFNRETPAKSIDINSFLISKYPTTNRQFMAFVNAMDGYLCETWWDWSSVSLCWFRSYATQKRAQTFGEFTKSKDCYPITNVSCYEAIAYCKWLSFHTGKTIRLPTEGEWEYAAKKKHTLFQWGDDFDPSKCNSSYSKLRDISPVGLFNAANEDASEMNGNIWEWCQSVYPAWTNEEETLTCYDETANFIDTSEKYNVFSDIRVSVRGGSFLNVPALQTNTFRGRDFMGEAFYRQGFRVIQELSHHSVIIPDQFVCTNNCCAVSKQGCGQSIKNGDTVRLAYKVFLDGKEIESKMTPDEAIEAKIGDGSLNPDIEKTLINNNASIGTTIENEFISFSSDDPDVFVTYHFWIYVQEKK